MSGIKPLTVRAGTVGNLKPLQQQGLERVVDYLRTLSLGPGLPETCRIIIEWGSKADLEILRDDER